MSLETPQEVNFFRGGSSHARGKRPPVVKGNGGTLSALLRKLIIINRQIFMPKHIIRGEFIMKRWWMVRAGDENELITLWRDKGIASIGWTDLGSHKTFNTKEELLAKDDKIYDESKPNSRKCCDNKVWRLRQ